MTREERKQRNETGIKKNTYKKKKNSPLQDEIECSFCNNFGHEESECKRKLQPKEQISTNSKVWKKKELQFESCDIDLFTEGEENQWYIDIICSKHMTGDKDKKKLCNALEKEIMLPLEMTLLLSLRVKDLFF